MTNLEFEKIYQLHFQMVYGYLMKLTQNQHIAEEITSDTFFKAMKSIEQFNGSCNIKTWLCQIAKNSYYSYLRKNKRLDPSVPIPNQEYADSLELSEKFVNTDTAMNIYQILHQLGEPYKEVFMLRTLGELSFKQIAEIFGKNENWACVTYHRAKNKIQAEMEDYQ